MKRSVMALTVAVAAVSVSGAAAAVVASAGSTGGPPTPDFSAAVSKDTVDGYGLTLAPAVGDPNTLCFVVQDPAGPRMTGCGERTTLLAQGAELEGTDEGSATTTVGGYAAEGETSASLGTNTAQVTAQKFYVVKGPSDGVFNLYRGGEVVKQTDLGNSASIPPAG